MSSFNSSSFPDSLALSKEGSMAIGSIDEIQKLHIRTVPLGEQPRRLAHQESSRTFAVLTSPSQGPTGALSALTRQRTSPAAVQCCAASGLHLHASQHLSHSPRSHRTMFRRQGATCMELVFCMRPHCRLRQRHGRLAISRLQAGCTLSLAVLVARCAHHQNCL